MRWFKLTDSGIVLPLSKQEKQTEPVQEKRRYLFTQEDLLDTQLPKFIQGIIDRRGRVQSVFQTPERMCGRYAVVYHCEEELDIEIYC